MESFFKSSRNLCQKTFTAFYVGLIRKFITMLTRTRHLSPILSQMNTSYSLPPCLVVHQVPQVNASGVHVYCSCYMFRSTSGHRGGESVIRRKLAATVKSYCEVCTEQNARLCSSGHYSGTYVAQQQWD